MKRTFLFAGLILLFLSGSSFAQDSDLFSFDKAGIESEMKSLDNLEKFVIENPETTFSEMEREGNPLVSAIADPNSFSSLNLLADEPLGIGGFWWGCCLGPAGILVVYLLTEDKNETRSSVIGCVVSSVLFGGGLLLDGYFGWNYGPRYW